MAGELELFAGQLLGALTRLRDLHPDMTLLQSLFFLAVGNEPGITQRELYDRIESNDSVASRTIAILSDIGNRNTEALGLVEMRVNPKDRRERQLYLTPKGRRLLEDIQRDVGRLRR